MEKGGAWDSEEIERKKGKNEREEEDAVNVMNSEKRRGGKIVDIIETEKRLVSGEDEKKIKRNEVDGKKGESERQGRVEVTEELGKERR